MKILFTNYTFDLYNSGKSIYYEHIPFYIYSLLETQPNAFVRIYINTKLNQEIKDALSIITNKNFEIIEDYSLIQYTKHPIFTESQFYKSLRWLLDSKHFKGFDCGYIGDIDFLIQKENEPIMDAHLEHCKKIGLPFSNGIRPNGKQMTGLHFIKCKEYFEKMDIILNNAVVNNLKEEVVNIKDRQPRNEHILYELLNKGIGFNGMEEQITDGKPLYYRPHHGCHLGTLRVYDNYEKLATKPHYLEDKEFLELYKIIPNEQIRKTINHFNNIKK
jgi:hypothetical protein